MSYTAENRLVVNYGMEIQKMVYEALVEYNAKGLIKNGQRIIIKPNLVNSTPASRGATTHPEVVEGIIKYLFDNGHKNVEILESSWVGGNTDEAFRVCGYQELAKKYGVKFVNALTCKFVKVPYKGLKIDIAEDVLQENSFLINVPVMKAHCQTRMTCAIKNLKGLIPAQEKRNFHALGLHEPIAALGALIKNGLIVVDGICGDLTFEEGGTPVESNMVLVGENPVTVDSFVCEFIGYEPESVKYLKLARDYGVGEFFSEKTQVTVLNADEKPKKSAKASGAARELSTYIEENGACSACYAALIHALNKADKATLKKYKDKKIAIGQGFKGARGEGLGFGTCTAGFERCVLGCPPKALDILKEL